MDVERVTEEKGLQNNHGQCDSTGSNPEKGTEEDIFKCWQLCFWETGID